MNLSRTSTLITTLIGCSFATGAFALQQGENPLIDLHRDVLKPGSGLKEQVEIDISSEAVGGGENIYIWQMKNSEDAFVNVGQFYSGNGEENRVLVNTEESNNADVYVLQIGDGNHSKTSIEGGNNGWGNLTGTLQIGSDNGAIIEISGVNANQNKLGIAQVGDDNNSWVEVLKGGDDNEGGVFVYGDGNNTYITFEGAGVTENYVAVGIEGDTNYVQSIVKSDTDIVEGNSASIELSGRNNRVFTDQQGSSSMIYVNATNTSNRNNLSITQTGFNNNSSVDLNDSNRNVIVATQAGESTLDVRLRKSDSNSLSIEQGPDHNSYVLVKGNGAMGNVGFVVQN